MFIVLVHIEVLPEHVPAFITAALDNARHSLEEPGVARFDVIQQEQEPNKFTLVEVYRSEEDAKKHKQTEHYLRWRDTVADMMAVPRQGVRYTNVFPGEQGWD
jgi:quinol monooxygenase YgiN